MPSNVLGVIPARGGSKSIPNKNVADLNGYPLIHYSIQGARQAKSLTRCVVSTDSPEIAKIARELGGDVPFLRPADLATDTALSLPVIQHALRWVEAEESRQYDIVVMLQPTSPFRGADDIDAAVGYLERVGADSVISVVTVGATHPLRMKRIVGENHLVNYVDQGHEDMRPRQALPPVYIRNGALYIARRNVIMNENTFVGKDCRAYVMPEMKSFNIDTHDDLILAEHYMRKGARTS